jgi:calmodulin
MSADGDPRHQALREAFARYDRDGDGFITVAEYRALATSLGQEIGQELAEEMVSAMDLDGDGRIDFAEFVASMS